MNRRKALGLVSVSLAMGARPARAASKSVPVLVIGATARMAPAVMEEALAQGHPVIALARNPEKITLKHPMLKTVKGDVYDVQSLAAAMTGKETVISCVGPAVDPKKEAGYVDIYSVGIAATIFAMKQKGNKRLIAISSGGTEMIPDEPPTNGDKVEEFVWHERNLYGDMRRMEKIIAVSGIEYAIFRPRGFHAGPKLGNTKVQIQTNAQDFDQYKDRSKRVPNQNSSMSFADLAAVVVSAVEGKNPYLGTATGIYTDAPG